MQNRLGRPGLDPEHDLLKLHPVQCYSCANPLAMFSLRFDERMKFYVRKDEEEGPDPEGRTAAERALNDLGLTRTCCRVHMISAGRVDPELVFGSTTPKPPGGTIASYRTSGTNPLERYINRPISGFESMEEIKKHEPEVYYHNVRTEIRPGLTDVSMDEGELSKVPEFIVHTVEPVIQTERRVDKQGNPTYWKPITEEERQRWIKERHDREKRENFYKRHIYHLYKWYKVKVRPRGDLEQIDIETARQRINKKLNTDIMTETDEIIPSVLQAKELVMQGGNIVLRSKRSGKVFHGKEAKDLLFMIFDDIVGVNWEGKQIVDDAEIQSILNSEAVVFSDIDGVPLSDEEVEQRKKEKKEKEDVMKAAKRSSPTKPEPMAIVLPVRTASPPKPEPPSKGRKVVTFGGEVGPSTPKVTENLPPAPKPKFVPPTPSPVPGPRATPFPVPPAPAPGPGSVPPSVAPPVVPPRVVSEAGSAVPVFKKSTKAAENAAIAASVAALPKPGGLPTPLAASSRPFIPPGATVIKKPGQR